MDTCESNSCIKRKSKYWQSKSRTRAAQSDAWFDVENTGSRWVSWIGSIKVSHISQKTSRRKSASHCWRRTQRRSRGECSLSKHLCQCFGRNPPGHDEIFYWIQRNSLEHELGGSWFKAHWSRPTKVNKIFNWSELMVIRPAPLSNCFQEYNEQLGPLNLH